MGLKRWGNRQIYSLENTSFSDLIEYLEGFKSWFGSILKTLSGVFSSLYANLGSSTLKFLFSMNLSIIPALSKSAFSIVEVLDFCSQSESVFKKLLMLLIWIWLSSGKLQAKRSSQTSSWILILFAWLSKLCFWSFSGETPLEFFEPLEPFENLDCFDIASLLIEPSL